MVCTGLVVLRSQEREHHVPSMLICVCKLNIDDITHSKVGASHTMDMGEKKMDDGSMGGMSDGMDHGSMGGMSMGCGNLAAAKPYIDANMLMHTNMAVPLTCTHTVDFVRAMIPHHKGAIAMCEVLVSEDAYLVELCVNITRVQRAEVAWMSQWLEARDHVVDAPCGLRANGNCDPADAEAAAELAACIAAAADAAAKVACAANGDSSGAALLTASSVAAVAAAVATFLV